jgi:hypothetical protein
VDGVPPADVAAQLRVCDKVCQPWRPLEPPKDAKKGGSGSGSPPPPPPAQTPAAKYDPGAGVLV